MESKDNLYFFNELLIVLKEKERKKERKGEQKDMDQKLESKTDMYPYVTKIFKQLLATKTLSTPFKSRKISLSIYLLKKRSR